MMTGAINARAAARAGRLAWLLVWACLAPWLAGCSQPATPAAPSGARSALETRAQELAGGLTARRQRALALCDLAAKASASAPDLARGMYEEAWVLAKGLADPMALSLAQDLRQEASGDQGQGGQRMLALAQRLEDRGRRAWPLRVVAEGAQALLPEVATQALKQGLALAKQNPDLEARDQDLGGLCLVLARRDPAAGRALASELGDPLWRSWIWRQLAMLDGGARAWEQAAHTSRELPVAALRASELASTALASFESDPALGLTLFEEAFQTAGGLPSPRDRALLQGQVAAKLVRVDAESGWQLAKRIEPLAGARFKACRGAGLALLGSDPVAGRRALQEAWESAQTMTLPYERQRAVSLLAQDLAVPDPALARELLASLEPSENLLRGEAEAAMVLAGAAQNPLAARAKAQEIKEPLSRLRLMMRLSAKAISEQAPDRQQLLDQALELARQLGVAESLRFLALEWAATDARKGVDIAAGIGENEARAAALSGVARVLAQRGLTPASEWALFLARDALDGLKSDQALDKARILGDMGQEWAALNSEVSRRFFKEGAEVARNMGQTS